VKRKGVLFLGGGFTTTYKGEFFRIKFVTEKRKKLSYEESPKVGLPG